MFSIGYNAFTLSSVIVATGIILGMMVPFEETVYINNHLLNSKYKEDNLTVSGRITMKRRLFTKSVVTSVKMNVTAVEIVNNT